MQFVTREQWGARPPDSTTPWNPSKLDGVTVHWFGSPNGSLDHANCDNLMRSVQNTHMGPGGLGTTNGGSDIGYNHVICPHSYVYIGRGYNVQTGANGTTESNRNYAAACVMMGTQNAPAMFSPKVQATLRELIQSWFDKGTARSVKKHGFWTGSTCPGPTIGAWVDAKKWAEVIVASPLPAWWDDFLMWQMVSGRYEPPAPKPTNVPADIPDWAWELATVVQKIIILNGAAESFMEYAYDRFVNGVTGPPPGMTGVPSLWWPDLESFHKTLNDYKAVI